MDGMILGFYRGRRIGSTHIIDIIKFMPVNIAWALQCMYF